MNLSDVKTRVKRQFGDESAVQITDEDITRWANDAQVYIVLSNEDLLEKIDTIDAVADQQDYSLPTDLLNLLSIHYKTPSQTSYFHLSGHSVAQFDTTVDGWDGNTYGSGEPKIYTIFADTLRIFPLPLQDSTDGIKFFYNRRPVELVNDSDDLDLPLVYHSAVVNFCLQQAYELDENFDASNIKGAQVDRDIHSARGQSGKVNKDRYPLITILPDDAW